MPQMSGQGFREKDQAHPKEGPVTQTLQLLSSNWPVWSGNMAQWVESHLAVATPWV